MRLGLALDLGSAAPVLDQVTAAEPLLRTAEEAGLDSLWIGESYHRQPQPFHLPAALVVLAHFSARTSLRLGTGVLLLRAYDPTRLGYESALVDQLSGGRLTVGVGLGAAELGARFGYADRTGAAHMDATLHALRAAWGHDDAAATAVPGPAAAGEPRLLVGGAAAASVRRAVELADGYYAATNYSDLLLAQQAAAYRGLGGTGDIVANRLCLVHEDGAIARATADRYLAPVVDYYSRRRLWHSTSDDTAPAPTTLVGSPAEVAETLERYADLGLGPPICLVRQCPERPARNLRPERPARNLRAYHLA